MRRVYFRPPGMPAASRFLALVTSASLCWTLALAASPAADPTPTFSRDVWPILTQRCIRCHRPGQIAPMSLLTYADARPYAKAMREMVLTRRMPPWYADAPPGRYSNDPRLSEQEIDVIRKWVEARAPEGEKTLAGPLPVFAEGWSLGEPDLVLEAPEQVIQPGPDQFRYLGLKYAFPEDTWIRGVEVQPGNRKVVHHANLAVLVPAATPGEEPEKTYVHVAVPGNFALATPEGTAIKLPKGGQLIFEPHYVAGDETVRDTTRIGLYFASGRITNERRNLEYQDFAFTIPPNAPSHFVRGTRSLTEDVDVVQVFCHMHLRGKSFSIVARTPTGGEERLLSVPRYNFNWQQTYSFAEPVTLPAGTQVEYAAEYDNSASNPAVLAWDSPDREVKWGLRTIDEMMAGSVFYTSRQARLDLRVDGKTGRVAPRERATRRPPSRKLR